jgi:uncharacterized membrane protein
MGLIKGERSIEIDAPADRCYDIVADVERTPEWAKPLKSLKVLERDSEQRAVLIDTLTDARMKTVRAVLRYSYEPKRAVRWTQVEGDAASLTGSWTFEDIGGGRTRATYAIESDPGKLLGKVMRGPAETIVREMLLISGTSGLREYAQSTARAGR